MVHSNCLLGTGTKQLEVCTILSVKFKKPSPKPLSQVSIGVIPLIWLIRVHYSPFPDGGSKEAAGPFDGGHLDQL